MWNLQTRIEKSFSYSIWYVESNLKSPNDTNDDNVDNNGAAVVDDNDGDCCFDGRCY